MLKVFHTIYVYKFKVDKIVTVEFNVVSNTTKKISEYAQFSKIVLTHYTFIWEFLIHFTSLDSKMHFIFLVSLESDFYQKLYHNVTQQYVYVGNNIFYYIYGVERYVQYQVPYC